MNNKRNTLKKVAGIGAVVSLAPNSWTKPIVSSVLLPAHAQTSENQPTLSISATGGAIVGGDNTNSIEADNVTLQPVTVNLSVNSPFTLSSDSLVFEPMITGSSETLTVDILNADSTLNSTESITVTWVEVLSSPVLDPISATTIQDNGGGIASEVPVTGTNILTGAVFSLTPVRTELTINSGSGLITWLGNAAGGGEIITVVVTVTNPDSASDSISFELTVEDNA